MIYHKSRRKKMAKKVATSKSKNENEMYKRMVNAAKDLQAALRFEPPLDHTLPEDELMEKLAEAAAEIQEGDILEDDTWNVLYELKLIQNPEEMDDDDDDDEEEKPVTSKIPPKSSPKSKTAVSSNPPSHEKKYTRQSALAEILMGLKTETITVDDLVDRSDQLYSDRTGKALNRKEAESTARRGVEMLCLFGIVEVQGDAIRIVKK